MWIFVVVAVVVLAAVVYAFWPRRTGVHDDAAVRARRSTEGAVESQHNSNRNQFPPF